MTDSALAGGSAPHGRPDARGIARLIGGNMPTEEQVAVVESPARPLLVVAGAGSGKTETMSMRVLWLVAHEGIDPGAILGLTFTRKAAGELGARLRDRLGRLGAAMPALADLEDPVSLTYNSFAERLVAEHGLRIGIDPDVRLLGQAGCVQMMTEVVQEWRDDLSAVGDRTPTSVIARALSLAGHVAEQDLSVEEARLGLDCFGEELRALAPAKVGGHLKKAVAATEERLALLDLVAEFSRRKRDAGVLDFGDQLLLATRIVREAPDVVDQLRLDHAAVLLDEFQDTSVIQMELLSRLFHDHPVTAVGDPNQAIYGWRGASAASLETFLQRFQDGPAEPSQTLTLSTSWRNDASILACANVVARPLRDHAVNAASPVLTPREGAGPGRVEVAYVVDRDAQARRVADFIEAHRVPRGSRMSTSAVVCRRRRDFQLIDDALRARDIPTQVIGLGGLLDQPAVADVRAALELSVDVTNSPWLLRLLAGLDLGAADLALLGQWARHLARRSTHSQHPDSLLLDAVDTPPEHGWRPAPGGPAFSAAAAARVRVLGQRLRAVRRGSGRGVVEQVERSISILGVAEDVLADPLLNTGREALDAFVDVAAQYQSGAQGAGMRGFLAWLAVAEDEENGLSAPAAEPDPDAVQILTIHGAKGLEWDSVAVVALDDGVFPAHRQRTFREWREAPAPDWGWLMKGDELPYPLRGDASALPPFVPDTEGGRTPQAAFNTWANGPYREEMGRHLEREERRLAYVAMTRARTHLLLAGTWVDLTTTPRPPSRYLMEPLMAGLTDSDPATALAQRPSPEDVQALQAGRGPTSFPPRPGRTRELVSASARRFLDRAGQLESAQSGAFQVLAALGDDPLVRDVQALLEERALRAERSSRVVVPSRLAATGISRLLGSPRDFAETLRRPVPAEPSTSAALGTVFHAWAERQLRLTSGELWDEPTPGEDVLSPSDRKSLQAMRRNFRSLDVQDQVPIAVEEPFAIQVGGVSIQGRIDAVFRDARGRDTVIDWKSGHAPSESTDPQRLHYFATQLRLYRTAWAQRTGVPESQVRARVAFLATPRVYDVEDLDRLLGASDLSVVDQVRDTLAQDGGGRVSGSAG